MQYYKCETCEHFVQHYGIVNDKKSLLAENVRRLFALKTLDLF